MGRAKARHRLRHRSPATEMGIRSGVGASSKRRGPNAKTPRRPRSGGEMPGPRSGGDLCTRSAHAGEGWVLCSLFWPSGPDLAGVGLAGRSHGGSGHPCRDVLWGGRTGHRSVLSAARVSRWRFFGASTGNRRIYANRREYGTEAPRPMAMDPSAVETQTMTREGLGMSGDRFQRQGLVRQVQR